MKYITFLIAALPFWSIISCNGQGFQAGVNASYLIHLQPEDGGPGIGVQGGAWASWAINRESRLRLSIGHRRLGGFNRLNLETGISGTPTDSRRTVSAVQLMALHYVDAELGWAFPVSPDSRWSFYAGVYYSLLANWQYYDRTLVSIDESGRKRAEVSSPNRPVGEELNDRDQGLRLGVSYRLLDGLSAQFQMRKGFSDLVPGSLFTDSPKDRLTAFSLGLSARLF
ncbi:MAG: hypothetical protein KDD19_11065 [Phaeodactylibacter sp.]|nr:hypothetical protein [Phaeodactylibacter sp.]MCB9053870.1 hypothetical protein [Lewinellaceae bacterium]